MEELWDKEKLKAEICRCTLSIIRPNMKKIAIQNHCIDKDKLISTDKIKLPEKISSKNCMIRALKFLQESSLMTRKPEYRLFRQRYQVVSLWEI